MKRRTALKQFGVVIGGAILLPSCFGKDAPLTISLHKIVITGNQEKVLAAIADCLIPKTETLGASDVKAHHFALRMVDDCYEPEAQQKFLMGLAQVEKAIEEKIDKTFDDASPEEQKLFLQEVEAGKIVPVLKEGEMNSIADFFAPFRKQLIRGYLGSEYVMTTIFGYNMVPGRFDGAVEINASSDLKTILG
jgi:hypothetical protein